MSVSRYDVEKVTIKLAYLDLIDMPLEELLRVLKIDMKKVKVGKGKLACPTCGLHPRDGALVVFNKEYTTNSEFLEMIKLRDDPSINAMTKDYYVCECKCIYTFYTVYKRKTKPKGPENNRRWN